MTHISKDLTDDPRKVWVVDVQIQAQIVVVAENGEDAQQVAKQHLAGELAHNLHQATYTPRVFTRPNNLLGGLSPPFGGTLPWGVASDDPRRDWSIEKWLGMW